jgi:hypothetical protein
MLLRQPSLGGAPLSSEEIATWGSKSVLCASVESPAVAVQIEERYRVAGQRGLDWSTPIDGEKESTSDKRGGAPLSPEKNADMGVKTHVRALGVPDSAGALAPGLGEQFDILDQKMRTPSATRDEIFQECDVAFCNLHKLPASLLVSCLR